MESQALSVLLSLMETGDVLETKYRRHGGVRLDTIVIGALNTSKGLPPELLSRFEFHLYFPKYTKDEFISTCQKYLSLRENITSELARYIGETVWSEGGDIRTARAITRILEEKTTREVDRVMDFLRRYSKRNVTITV